MSKKAKLILFEVLLLVILLCTSVYATIKVTLHFSINTDRKKLTPGQSFVITLSFKDVALEGNSGITDLEGYINYDKSVIEPLTSESFIKNENGTITIGGEEYKFEDLTNANESQIDGSSDGVISFNSNPKAPNDTKIIIGTKLQLLIIFKS